MGLHSVEHERARSARRVKHPLLCWVGHPVGHHQSGEPVGRVVLAKRFPVLRLDHRLVQHLQHVMFDRRPVEPGDPAGEVTNKVLAAGQCDGPVKEVLFDDAVDLAAAELLAGDQVVDGEARGDIEPDDGVRDRFCGYHQECVVDEQLRVVGKRVAVCGLE